MTMLIIPGKVGSDVWIKALHGVDPKLDIQIWPEVSEPCAIEFVLTWAYPEGELLKYPNLKCISSLGAGVDHILKDSKRPQHVPIVRIVDNKLIQDMTQYLVWAVINHIRLFDFYAQEQLQKHWAPHLSFHQSHVGIMGLGQIGITTACKLRDLGFQVNGWSRSAKDIAGINHFIGENELETFLQQTDILICLLPLTPETNGILNLKLFNKLRRGAYLINVARGAHLVEKDVLIALAEDQLSGACLDVFQSEPLPHDHPFWQHPKVKVTPHISGVTDPESVAAQIVENYYRAQDNKPLLNQVDVNKGY